LIRVDHIQYIDRTNEFENKVIVKGNLVFRYKVKKAIALLPAHITESFIF